MQVAVVTGATGGIGRWIARGLAEAGFHVVLVGRNADRGAAALDWLQREVPGSSAELMLADLSSLAETRALGHRIAAAHPRLAVLVNNAGIFHHRRELTAEGRERVLAVNHLSPFALTQELEPALRAGAPSRLVTIGSSTADKATIDPADLELTRGWGFKRAYARSKLATTITTLEWARRMAGTGVVANVVHPGTVATGLVRAPGIIGLAWRVMAPFVLTEQQGADTPVHVATSPDWARTTGAYVKNRRPVPPNPRALDPALAHQVWNETERLLTTPAAVPKPAPPPPRPPPATATAAS